MKSPSSIVWQADTHEHYERSDDWYWVVGIVGATTAALFMVFANWTMGIIVILCIGLLMWRIKQGAELLDCEINAKGIRINKETIPLKAIERYNIDQYGTHCRLILVLRERMTIQKVVPMGTVQEDVVESFLSFYGVERDEKLHEPFLTILMEYLGF
jgi:hypothetical protein